MKECELCTKPARMYCESDQASLCWECDAKVHSANFLVARHSRTLLCHVCQSTTPWQASGSKLGPTVTICERCVTRCVQADESDTENQEEEDHHDSNSDGDDESDSNSDGEDENEEEEEDDDGENQVVPWASTYSPPPPPPLSQMTSSSSSQESSSRGGGGGVGGGGGGLASSFPLKRLCENVDLCSQDEINSTSTIVRPKRALTIQSTQTEVKSGVIVKSIKRLEQQLLSGKDASAILGMCELSKDPRRSVDLVSTDS